MKRIAIAAAAVAAIVGVAAVGASESAGSSLRSCRQQQAGGAEAVVVTPTPTGTAAATPTPAATPAPTRRNRRSRRRQRQAPAVTSQLTADESGLPQAVDAEGEPVAGAAQLLYPFGADRDAITRRQAFLIPEDMNADRITVTLPFQDVTDGAGRPLTPAHLRAVVRPMGPGRLVTVSLCLNPTHPSEMRAGTYNGTALVGVDERVAPVTLQATVQDDRSLLVLLFGAIGLIGGLFVRLFADKQSTGHIERFRDVSRPRVIATLGAGAAVLVYSYNTIYLDDPTFHAGLENLWRVTAEVFTGTLAAKTLTDLAGQQKTERTGEDSQTTHVTIHA